MSGNFIVLGLNFFSIKLKQFRKKYSSRVKPQAVLFISKMHVAPLRTDVSARSHTIDLIFSLNHDGNHLQPYSHEQYNNTSS